jgi:hypothetical protein
MPPPRILRCAQLAQGCGCAVAYAVAAMWYPHARLGVLLGGFIMAVNLALMAYLIDKLHAGAPPRGLFVAALGGKFLLLMGAVIGMMQGFDPDLLGFAAGLATFFVGMAAATVLAWLSTARAPQDAPVGPAT